MKTKLILWGKLENDDKVLVAIELLENENKVKSYIFSEELATEEFYNLMLNEWRFDRDVEFPAVLQTYETPLTSAEDILPAGLLVEKPDLINRAKTEWHFVVLSKKLYDLFRDELENLKDNISELDEFSSEKWDELKLFWEKVQNHVKDKNLFRNHVESLKRRTDELFNKLKNLKNKSDIEIKEKSEETFIEFNNILDEIDQKIEKGLGLQPLFVEMKRIQKEFRDMDFTKEHRRKLWNRIDRTFKIIKEKRFGSVNKDKGALTRTEKRLNGLIEAIGKMEDSINRDKKEMDDIQSRPVDTMGQLESELRKARLMMIQERIDSKNEKLKNMFETRSMLESRIEKEKTKITERKKYEKAKKEAEENLKEKVKESSDVLKENEAELLKATEKIKEQETPVKEKLSDIIEKAEKTADKLLTSASDMAKKAIDETIETVEKIKEAFEEE